MGGQIALGRMRRCEPGVVDASIIGRRDVSAGLAFSTKSGSRNLHEQRRAKRAGEPQISACGCANVAVGVLSLGAHSGLGVGACSVSHRYGQDSLPTFVEHLY
jgi:hypothetical protein